jgi:dTDP-glucose 4,6-dehydratase
MAGHRICEIIDVLKPRADKKSYVKQINFVQDRLGHDKCYAIDNAKATSELGYKVSKSFEERLQETVSWFFNKI